MTAHTLLTLLALATTAVSAGESRRPNVILIVADDLGISALSGYGSDSFRTPHLDRMAAEGMRFQHAYATPVCGPSRVSLMTGRYPCRTGATNNATAEKVSPLEEVAFPRLLREAGYATFATGKWPWLGHMDRTGAWGFDETLLWNDRGTADRYWNPNLFANGVKRSYPGEFGPDVMQREILAFIDRTRARRPDTPFFVYYASPLPHLPVTHTPDSRGADIPFAEKYRDMILHLDKQVGELRSELERRGLAGSTLLLFTGDNGSIREAKESIRGRPVLGGKTDLTDGGTRVPLLACWPGTIPAGRESDALVDFTDFFPTLLELAGVTAPAGRPVDGRSFASLLRGAGTPARDWVHFQQGRQFAVRDHRWKLDQDGRLSDVSRSLHEETVVDPAVSPEAGRARAKLHAALVSLGLR